MFRYMLSCLILICSLAGFAQQSVSFKAADGLEITADYYAAKKGSRLIVTAHQAGWSRGEYAETSQWLNQLGFSVLALDARSGGEVKGVTNLTHQRAKAQGLAVDYLDAKQDLEAALHFARETYRPAALYLLGSSYSASLALLIAGEGEFSLAAVMAFSPGEYFGNKTLIQDAATGIEIPTFITSARNEASYWQPIAEKMNETYLSTFLPSQKGDHGSRALWSEKAAHQLYRGALRAFLVRVQQK